MSQPEQKILSSSEFLELLDDDDVAALWRKWQLPDSAQKSKKSPAFVEAVDARSNTTLLQEVMSLRTKTLQMLREVLEFLLGQQSAVRTTGSLLVLKEEFDIAPQQVDAALKWSKRATRRISSATWEELEKRFSGEVKPILVDIAKYGAVNVRKKREDYMKASMRARFGGGPMQIRVTNIASYDRDGFETRKDYGEKIEDLDRKVAELRDRVDNVHAGRLFSDIKKLSRRFRQDLHQSDQDIRFAEIHQNLSTGRGPTDEDHETWNIFVEDILFLADVEESGPMADVFRMDLFRKRPQLFEVWIVVVILRFMRTIGYKLEIKFDSTHAGRPVWNLNYAKSQTHIAKLTRASDGQQSFLFYQLFRPGQARDEMPDIALMPSERPEDTPIWIMDPKHSERGAYSLADYREVGTRYQAAFSPLRTWIVEYYARPKLGNDNPLILGQDVELLRDVSPGGEGHQYLLRELRALHRGTRETLVLADVSGSFGGNLPRLAADLRRLWTEGVTFYGDIIWFSDRAQSVSFDADALDRGELHPPDDLGGGTRFAPALELAEAVCKDARGDLTVRIYTDSQFSDVSPADAIGRLQKYATVEIVDFSQTMDVSTD